MEWADEINIGGRQCGHYANNLLSRVLTPFAPVFGGEGSGMRGQEYRAEFSCRSLYFHQTKDGKKS